MHNDVVEQFAYEMSTLKPEWPGHFPLYACSINMNSQIFDHTHIDTFVSLMFNS